MNASSCNISKPAQVKRSKNMQTARVLPARASPTGFGMRMKLSGKVIILDVLLLLGATKRNGSARIIKYMA